MAVLGLFLLSACSPSNRELVDKLNLLSYSYHYRQIDSADVYARKALDMAADYKDGQAEAINNLAFVSIIRMEYDRADSLLDMVPALTDNQIEQLVCYVQRMRLCQRRSNNREFYEYREKAINSLNRIDEERDQLTASQLRRLVYAESEMAIVTSAYYYYVGLEQQSAEALLQLNTDEVRHDTAQYLNYLYNVGAGGILTDGTAEQIHSEEMDYLTRCLSIARRYGYSYFEAQANEAIAEHTGDLAMAEDALQQFILYGDVYQIAGAYRTLASCYHSMGDDAMALENLEHALADSAIFQAPDLVASIREQLSVAYSAVNDKQNSDYNRNIYIDLQEQTRQDRELEARAGILETAVMQLNWMILAVMAAILLLIFLLWLFNYLNKRQQTDHQLDDQLVELGEELSESRMRIERYERNHLEQRAKISLATSILPLIDRIIYTVGHLSTAGNDEMSKTADSEIEYIRELTDTINEKNKLLTQWIQMRQGELSLHIESFAVQTLFDIMSRSKTAFRMKDIDLEVTDTDAVVKADRVLTLFMINTLADNARKFTPRGGKVTISAETAADYVEISVTDNGCGMSAEQLAHVFDHKVIRDQKGDSTAEQQGHGFGLLNCQGIIDKYRKTSRLFSVCLLSAESHPGSGSRFFFRLPRGVARMLVACLGLLSFAYSQPAYSQSMTDKSHLDRAHIYADSAYFCNINGRYRQTLLYADSCRMSLNAHYRQHAPKGKLLMTAQASSVIVPAEIQWLHDGLETNYQIILDIRNESAVAALALHEWALYTYNNKVYTQLFKELSADDTLADYCRTMQQSQSNKRIAVILLLVLLVMIIPAYYLLYYRQRLYERFRRERLQRDSIEITRDALQQAELEVSRLHVANAVLDNCLSTLKHETMYYPSRIRQLADTGQMEMMSEVTGYYRELYAMLIRQAVQQVESIHLHVRPIELYGQKVLGDDNMLRYLFELIVGTKGGRQQPGDGMKVEVKDDKYVVYGISLQAPLSSLDSLLCRQILRDHGEATNRRGCGIVEDDNYVTITLPRYNGKV
ncbi:MAG: DUF5112 domain-containing protein [Prevotella sp.]|nr:DUF5112 domain-containing protein [Prevotella sp.]